LDCTLILHILLGKDQFISVTAEYEPTCFGNTLSQLTRLPGPIRDLNGLDELLTPDRAINAPREIMRLVNWMMTNNSCTDDTFVQPANPAIVDTIHECLDTGKDFPFPPEAEDPRIPLAFGETLLRLLDSLAEPIFPPSLHSTCLQIASRDEAFELLDLFSPAAVNVWITLTAFLHFLAQSASEDSSARAEKIATIFAPVLLRDDPTSATPPISPLAKREFLLYFVS